jgi:DNA-binding MarR family transcriptional regulator
MIPETLSLTRVLHDWTEVFMRRSFRDFKRFMDEADLSPSQVSALMQLHRHGACGVSDIAERTGFTKPAASQMVERLVQQGLLQRSEDLTDRRVKQVTLTPTGRLLIEGGFEARRRWMEQLTDTLTSDEQQKIANALLLLTEAARKLEQEQEFAEKGE